MICHNKRILKKRAAEKADQEMSCVTEYAIPFGFMAIAVVVLWVGYLFWDYHEFMEGHKKTSALFAEALNGKVIVADDMMFSCSGKKIELVKGLK